MASPEEYREESWRTFLRLKEFLAGCFMCSDDDTDVIVDGATEGLITVGDLRRLYVMIDGRLDAADRANLAAVTIERKNGADAEA